MKERLKLHSLHVANYANWLFVDDFLRMRSVAPQAAGRHTIHLRL